METVQQGQGSEVATEGTPAPGGAWYDSFDADTKGFIEAKGYNSLPQDQALPEIIKGYRGVEKLMGVPSDKLLRIPGPEADSKAMDEFYTKLGRPALPTEYAIPVPEGVAPDFANWAQDTFHDAGLNKSQANKMLTKFGEFTAKQQEAQKEAQNAQMVKDMESLKAEWGGAFDQHLGVAKQAAAMFGWDDKMIDKLDVSMGRATFMKFMHDIGSRIGEDKFVSGSSNNKALTPEGAKSKIDALKGDGEWVAKYLAGNVEAKNEMDRLQRMLAGG